VSAKLGISHNHDEVSLFCLVYVFFIPPFSHARIETWKSGKQPINGNRRNQPGHKGNEYDIVPVL